MDREVTAQKLESLRRCVARIREKCPPGVQTDLADPDTQDVVVLNLTRAVQLCVDIGAHWVAGSGLPPPDTMGQTFDVLAEAGFIPAELALRMKRAVGFRNVAVHNYRELDRKILAAIVANHVDDFDVFARAVVKGGGG